MESSVWMELAAVGALILLSYLGARLVSRLSLPAVTGFMIVGILLGPQVLGLLTPELLDRLSVAEPLALGLVVFLIGEKLTMRVLATHHRSVWTIVSLNLVLPAAFVAWIAMRLAPGDVVLATLLAVIAVSGAPATLMAVLAERKRKSQASDTLLAVSAVDNVATVVAFSVAVPYLLWSMGVHASVGFAVWRTLSSIGGALLVGVAGGLVIATLLANVRERGELLVLGLTGVLLTVALARALDAALLLAPLAAGVTVAAVSERRGRPGRVFRAVRTIEYPVYVVFFTIAGAELKLDAVVAGGVLMLGYIVARSAGKFLAGFGGSLLGGARAADGAWMGLAMLPQAGVAVGLALSTATVFPEAGPTVNAVVLASIVFFEAIGPIAAGAALARIGGEVVERPEERDALEPEGGRVAVFPVDPVTPKDRVLIAMDRASEESAIPIFFLLLAAVRPRANPDQVVRARAHVDDVAEAAIAAGFRAEATMRYARSQDAAVESAVRDYEADLVVLVADRVAGGVPWVRRRGAERVCDAADVPVLLAPAAECEPFEPAG